MPVAGTVSLKLQAVLTTVLYLARALLLVRWFCLWSQLIVLGLSLCPKLHSVCANCMQHG